MSLTSPTSPLPRPPRTVRVRAAFATWWLFGVASAIALATALLTGVALLASDDFRLPRGDWRLDDAPGLALARGEVLSVVVEQGKQGRAPGARCGYAFAADDGVRREGSSWTTRPPAVGDRVPIEYLAAEPELNRLRGGHRARAALWWPLYATPLLAAVLACGIWLARVYQTWVLLRHGRAAPARLLDRQALRARPPHVRVRYAFATDDDRQHEGRQWVRVGSDLDRALAAAPPGADLHGAFAVHLGGGRQRRLVASSDVAEAEA